MFKGTFGCVCKQGGIIFEGTEEKLYIGKYI